MQKVANMVSKKEESLKLMTEHKKQCIMPDVVFEGVNHMVRFRRRHGTKKHIEEPLTPQRMYIIHDTVEILQGNEDLAHYAGIDKPTHRTFVENSKHQGFVKLNHVEYLNVDGVQSSNSSTISDENSEAYESSKNFRKTSPSTDSKPSTSYSTDVEDSEIEYGPINASRIQRPLSIQASARNYSGGLPPNCIQEVKMKNLQTNTIATKGLYVTKNYILSSEFMAHFRDVFSATLGEALGFSPEELLNTTYNTSGIFCETVDDYGRLIKCEIIPAVLNPWPDLDDWINRERNTVIDRLSTRRYVWPSKKMIEEIVKLPSLTIPRGFLPKKGKNEESQQEWEVVFPKTEKYLHNLMSHAQIRCFLFLVTLYKTFIEPVTEKKGLLIDHIRTLIFWECEKNYIQWLDDKLGTKLIKVLQTLYAHLGRENLPDYFMSDRNLFENIPGKYLRTAQQYVHNIMEKPVVHFLYALRNLTYPSERFYPTLNFDELYSMLYTKESLNVINSNLYRQVEIDIEHVQTKTKKKLTAEQEWDKMKIEETKKRLQEKKNKQMETNLTTQPRESKDSIDLTKKLNDEDPLKSVAVIPFFIEHFIKIAEVSVRYQNRNQALFYIKNAYYLSKVLETLPSGGILAHDWQQKIKHTEDICKRQSVMELHTPNLPMRNSSIAAKEIQVKTRKLDMNNLSLAKNVPVIKKVPSQKTTWTEINMIDNNSDTSGPSLKTVKTARFSTKVDIVDFNHIK